MERDFDDLGHTVRRPATLLRWMNAYAAATASTASWETIRDAATGGEGQKPAKTTTLPYREVGLAKGGHNTLVKLDLTNWS